MCLRPFLLRWAHDSHLGPRLAPVVPGDKFSEGFSPRRLDVHTTEMARDAHFHLKV